MSATDATKPYLPHSLRSKPFLTAKEVRAILRCSHKTVQRYLAGGHLVANRINRRRFLYETESVAAFLEKTRPRT